MDFSGSYSVATTGIRFLAQELFQQRYDEGRRPRVRPNRRRRRRVMAHFPGREVAPKQPIYPESVEGSNKVPG